ncbi:MAG: response regulator, partial [Gammaproteobacteria bacterium]|nr:response regulator [Gammaproteobacteria bacterium]
MTTSRPQTTTDAANRKEPSRPLILVVDDILDNLLIISNILEPHYQLRTVKSGEQALKVAAQLTVDLILLDVRMPEMDGYEVCNRLKANPYTVEIPVIFVTAAIDATEELQGLSLGGVDYISKPINPAILLARIETQLTLHRTLQQQKRDNFELRKLLTALER